MHLTSRSIISILLSLGSGCKKQLLQSDLPRLRFGPLCYGDMRGNLLFAITTKHVRKMDIGPTFLDLDEPTIHIHNGNHTKETTFHMKKYQIFRSDPAPYRYIC